MEGQLQPETEQFLYKYIDSIEQLEVLLLLFASRDRWWSVEQIYDVVKSNSASIARRLDRLFQQGLVVVHPELKDSYRFQVSDEELARTVEQLSTAYAERRLRVIEAIFSKPSPSIQSFADAFRIRKEKENG